MGKYKRKTDRTVNEENMLAALREVHRKRMTYKEASKRFGIPSGTIFHRLKTMKKQMGSLDGLEITLEMGLKNRDKYSKHASNQVFTNEEERLLVEYLSICSKINDGLTFDVIRESGYRLAVSWDKKFPESWARNHQAGIDWANGFIGRHKDIPFKKGQCRKTQDDEKEDVKVQDKWKWYDTSSFLKELKDLGCTEPNLLPNDNILDILGKSFNQPDSEEASSTSTSKLKSKNKKSTKRSKDKQLDSTNEIYIVDPDTDIACKSEDEEVESLQHQTDSAVDVLSPEPQSEEEEPEDPIASKPRLSKAKRKFIIDGVCSSVTFQMSNEELCEDDLVAFHSDLITYMHSYFNKRRKK